MNIRITDIICHGSYSQYVQDASESLEHQENCSQITISYLHALNAGSSKSHVKRGRTAQQLEYIKAE